MKIKNILHVALLFSAGLYFSACLKSEFKYEVRLISGDNQNGFAGQPLLEPIVVESTNDKGQPAPELRVDFKRQNGTVLFSSTTDALGRSSYTWLLDCNEGQQKLHVVFKTRNGYPIDSVIVSANATAATSGWIKSCGLDFQSGNIPSTTKIKKSPTTGFLYLVFNNRLYESSDKGRSWEIIGTPINTFTPFISTMVYDFAPSGKIFVLDSGGNFFSSSDVGQTWKTNLVSNFFGVNDLLAINENELMYAGSVLQYSSDQGLSWIMGNSTYFNNISVDGQGHILGTNNSYVYTITNQGQDAQYLLNAPFLRGLRDKSGFGYVIYDNGYKLNTFSHPFTSSAYIADLSLVSSPYDLTSVDVKNGKVLITSQTNYPLVGSVGGSLGYTSGMPWGYGYDCIINDDNSVAVLTAYGVYFNPNPW